MVTIANLEDIDEIINVKIQIQKEAWKNEYNVEDEKLAEAYKKYFLEHMNKDCIIFIKRCDNQIAAMSTLLILDNLPYCKDLSEKYGYITGVSTLKEFRNKGYQHEIMEYLIEFAKKQKLRKLKLDSSNPIAIKIYQKHNFEIHEKDRVIMELYLEN